MLVDNEDKISLFARFRHNLENLWSSSRPRPKRSIEGEESQKTTKLSENLLTESLNGHKLRNVAMKVARLNPQKDQITKEILDQFCRPKMVNCSLQNEDSKLDLENHEFPWFGHIFSGYLLSIKMGSGVFTFAIPRIIF